MNINIKKIKKFIISDILGDLIYKVTSDGYVIKNLRSEGGMDGRVAAYLDRKSHVAEQYKVLRTDLRFLSPEKPIKSIVITSSQSKEGKTVTCCNLAASIALEPGKKCILIDADLRKPEVHHIFNLQRKPGFIDILDGTVELEYFLRKPVIDNLYVIPAGSLHDNPSEKMDPKKMKDFIERLEQDFDAIIFDTPPVLSTTDASILGSLCDAVFLVVKAGVTQKDIILEAFEFLKNAHARPKGCILTNMVSTAAYDYYYSKRKP